MTLGLAFLLLMAVIIIPLALWSERNIRQNPQPEKTNDDDDFEFPTFI